MSSPVSSSGAGDDRAPVLRALPHPQTLARLAPLTPLIGRTRELARLLDLLRQTQVRLVTLTGAGGIGKTRLALEAAGNLQDAFADGVVFVSLAPVREPALAISTIAQAVGVRDMADRSTTDQIAIGLADASMLLVLDNLEQVPGVAQPIAEILAGCPGVKMLATSRGSLHLPGERELPLSPLPVLRADRSASCQEIAALPSVRLFIERATAVRPDFALTEQNAETIAGICSRLDGLPLAIELAAARSRILPPAAILARLEKRLPFLTAGSPTLPERQQTLRNTIAWSYSLLSDAEKRLLRRLGVFSGGFTLGAAEAICAAVEPVIDQPLDSLAGLVDKGMLALPEEGEHPEVEPRFLMLETIREFALEQLAESGEAGEVRDAHARHVLDEAEQAEAIYLRGDNTPWLARIVAEQENIRAALTWLIERQDAEGALRLSAASIWLWFVRGQFQEGRGWIDQVLAAPWAAVRSVARCRALYAAGMLAHYQGAEARVCDVMTECESLSREIGATTTLARSLLLRGVAAEDAGRYADAVPLFEEALALFRAMGDTLWTAQALVHQGIVAFGLRDLTTAIARCEEGLAVYRQIGDKLGAAVGISGALDTLSLAAMQQDRQADAIRLQREALGMRSQLGDRRGVALSVAGVATIAAAGGDLERAARLFGAAEALREAVGWVLAHPERDLYEAAIARLRRLLPADRFAAAWAAGQALTEAEAVADAMTEPLAVPAAPPERRVSGLADQHRLTARELEVLRLIADGRSDREIADALFISPRTVMRHVANVFAKLDVHSRGAAGAYARAHGLI